MAPAVTDSTPTRPKPQKVAATWWYSADAKRGFCWTSVVGYSYHQAGSPGFNASVLYLYLTSAILTLHAKEADSVYEALSKR